MKKESFLFTLNWQNIKVELVKYFKSLVTE